MAKERDEERGKEERLGEGRDKEKGKRGGKEMDG